MVSDCKYSFEGKRGTITFERYGRAAIHRFRFEHESGVSDTKRNVEVFRDS